MPTQTEIIDNKIEKKIERYARLSLHYSDNAQKFLKNKEFEKASEMMWGAMASILKAKGAEAGLIIGGHAKLWEYAGKLSKETNNPEIFNSFELASNLHKNFYESYLSEQELRIMIKRMARTIGNLMKSLGYRPR